MRTHLDLFSGIGGFALAARWAGIQTVQFVEIDPFCQKVLKKNFPGVPIHDDIKTFHWGDKCEVTNNKWQIDEILNSHKKQSDQGELFSSANNAENPCQFLQAPISGEGHIEDFAPINAVMNLSGEITHLTQTVVSGCGEIETLTTKMEGQKNVNKNGTKMEKLKDGGVGSLQGINTSAKCVDTTKGNYSMPTTLSRGKTTRKNDSTLTTESRYANSVTRSNTGEIFLLTAGTPCQPASCAGKRGGHNDDRWLWEETFRVIAEVKPRWCILENVAGILSLEQGVVFDYLLTSLENQGFETQTYLLPACAVNAPHRRDRVWIIANSKESERKQSSRTRTGREGFTNNNINAPDPSNQRLQGSERHGTYEQEQAAYGSTAECNHAWSEPWIEAAQRFCKLDAGLPSGLARCLTYPETYGIIGFMSFLREYHYGKINEDWRTEVLPILQHAFNTEQVSELFGRFHPFFTEEILRCPVHGTSHDERYGDKIGVSLQGEKTQGKQVREVRIDNDSFNSPHRRGYTEQCSCEFDDIVCELSSEIALGEWKGNTEKAENILFNLWKESRGERFLYEPLSALYEIWRSVTDKEIGSFRRHYHKRDEHRVQKLKALGNAVVPQVAFAIMQAIIEVDNETKKTQFPVNPSSRKVVANP